MSFPPSIEAKPPPQRSMHQRRELMPFKIEHTAEKEVDAVDRASRVERCSTADCRPSTDKTELLAIPGRKPMSATSLKAVRFLLAPAEVGERMAGGWGRAAQRLRSSRSTPS